MPPKLWRKQTGSVIYLSVKGTVFLKFQAAKSLKISCMNDRKKNINLIDS